MSWVRVDVSDLRRRGNSPAVPAAIRIDPGWARSYIDRPASPPPRRDDSLEPDRWMVPAHERR